MNRRTLTTVTTLARSITAPLVMSVVIAVALVLDHGVALAAVLAAAGLILLVVRSFAPHEDPLREVGDVMLRGGRTEEEWLKNLRHRQQEASERKLRVWRKNAWGAWLVIAALFVLLARSVIATFGGWQ